MIAGLCVLFGLACWLLGRAHGRSDEWARHNAVNKVLRALEKRDEMSSLDLVDAMRAVPTVGMGRAYEILRQMERDGLVVSRQDATNLPVARKGRARLLYRIS